MMNSFLERVRARRLDRWDAGIMLAFV